VSAATAELSVGAAASLAEAPATAPNLFVIPVYNEEDNLPRLVADLESRPWLWPDGSRVIVVDDGSADRTPDLVRNYDGPLPLELVCLPENQGPGAAFRAGFAAALADCPADAYIVTLEGDTTSDLDALPRMLERALDGTDLVLASWRMVNVSRRRRLLSAAAGFVVRHALGLDAKTVSSFFRVYRASTLRAADERYGARLIEEEGFACKAELLGKLARMGASIDEVTVDLDWGRREGTSKMPVGKTMFAYSRMLVRERGLQETTSA
jgi:dolichol-phosphate mannosyltransferase